MIPPRLSTLLLVALVIPGCGHPGEAREERASPAPLPLSEPRADSGEFYSRLSQSAAIIIGLLGGILAIRAQEQRSRVSERRQQALAALRDLDKSWRRQLSRLVGFVEHWPEQARFLRELQAMGRTEFSYQGDWYHPEGVSPSRAGSIESELASERVFREARERAIPLLQEARRNNGLDQAALLERSLAYADMELLKDRLGGLMARAGGAARALRALESEGKVAAHWGLWSCLVVMGVAGVLAALMFLSDDPDPIKAGITALFALALVLLLAFTAFQIRSILVLARIPEVLPSDASTRQEVDSRRARRNRRAALSSDSASRVSMIDS